MSVSEAKAKLISDTSSIPNTPQRPLFILLEQVNMFDDERTPKLSSIEYSYENIENLFDILEHPEQAWEIYNKGTSTIGSDPVAKIASKNKKPSEREEYPDIWETLSIAVYNSNEDTQSKLLLKGTVFSDFVENIPPFTQFQRHKNGVFNAKFSNEMDMNLNGVNPLYKSYWKQIVFNREERINFCFKKQLIDPMLNEEQRKAIGCVPCAIYALKQLNVEEAVIRELYRNHICYGNVIKTRDFRAVLNSFKYRLIIYKISVNRNHKLTITNDQYPRRNKDNYDWNVVALDYYKGHLMAHEEVVVYDEEKDKTKYVPFLRILEDAFEAKLLKPMNSYEFVKAAKNRGFMTNYKQSSEELLADIEDEHVFDDDLESFRGFNKQLPSEPIFADFECSTDEKYHRPYCISFTDYEEIGDDTRKTKRYRYTGISHYWGEYCGEYFLKHLQEVFCYQVCHWEIPVCTVYFHNLRYDFTFLIKYLRDIKLVKKGNKLYSATGKFGKGENKICIEFRDTLPLLQMSLKSAGNAFLDEETKKTIRKEVFPYELYTYELFENFSNGWIPVEYAKSFFNEEKYKEFLLNLKKSLPFIPEYKEGKIEYKSNLYVQREEEGTLIAEFNYKEYAFFYCDQDVRVLRAVMNKFDCLMSGKNIEGINGTPPFGQTYSPYKYLTISSLAYDFCLKSCVMEWRQEKDENGELVFIENSRGRRPSMKWLPKYENDEFFMSKGLLRYIGHQTIRGGRVMTRDNEKFHYIMDENNKNSILVDYDGVSLYPSAISRLWMTAGKPKFIKGQYSEKDFMEKFTHPDAEEGDFKQYNDGWIHVYSIMCWKDRHFPLLCVKDEKTKLNEYQNFHGAVDTWVNAIDLFNMIEFQNATFYWDAAVVWEGKRYYDCRKMITELFEFRAKNKTHPIQLNTKLMMNSIYGKSALKPTNYVEKIIDCTRWKKLGEDENKKWEKVDNWRNKFNANAYKIKEFTYLDKEHIAVKYHELDTSANYVQFGSNVLAMARRIIGRVMALAEDMEELHPECAPGLFYTDTDSMHIRKDLLKYTEDAYMEKYGQSICGKALCQFHIDFDPCKNYKEGENVLGAVESWFIMKKMYADKLLGSQGSIGYHQRMKGVPSDLVHWEHYARIYNDEFVEFDLLENGHVSFFYEDGMVGSRRKMTRQIATKAAREELQEDLNTVNNFVKALEQLEKEEQPAKKRKVDEDEDDNTIEMLPSEQEWEDFDENAIVDIE